MNSDYIAVFALYDVWSLVILRANKRFRESTKFLRKPPTKLSEEFPEWSFSNFPRYCSPEKLTEKADPQTPSSEILIQKVWGGAQEPELSLACLVAGTQMGQGPYFNHMGLEAIFIGHEDLG